MAHALILLSLVGVNAVFSSVYYARVLQTRYLRCEVNSVFELERVCARATYSCKSALTPTRHVRNRVCAIDGRCGAGVQL